jgi:predicted RNA-binding protein with TRAM domain
LEASGDDFVVRIPDELVENGSLAEDEPYRVALLESQATTTDTSSQASETSAKDTDTASTSTREDSQSDDYQSNGRSGGNREQSPPVEEGEVRSVTIDTLGDQGDGIARVERGFIIIVSDTQPGDQVDIEITDVADTVAFAEPVSEPTVR